MLNSMAQVTPAAPTLGGGRVGRGRAYEALRQGIADGRHAPGDWLREGPLAQALGLSRTPVREALRALAAEGLVELVHNRGARVVRWTADDVEETYRLRALLEGEAASLAARRASAADRLLLEQTHLAYAQSVGQARPTVEQAALNDAFHAAVLHAAASPRLVALHAVITSAPLVARALAGYDDIDRQRSVLAHADILLAVRTGDDGLARAAMAAHILAARHVAAQRSVAQ